MGILDTIKKAGLGAVEAGNPVAILYGTVKSINPLEVIVDQRFPLTEDFLIVPERIRELVPPNELKPGQQLLLLRVQGGNQYVIWDRV